MMTPRVPGAGWAKPRVHVEYKSFFGLEGKDADNPLTKFYEEFVSETGVPVCPLLAVARVHEDYVSCPSRR